MNIIFDMDGVLIKSEYAYSLAIQRVLADHGVDVDLSYIDQYRGRSNPETWQEIIADFSVLDQASDYYIDRVFSYREEIVARDGIIPCDHILELLNAWHGKGYRMSVASSSPMSEIERTMDALGIRSYFEHLVTGEAVAQSKPAPDIFLYSAKLMNLEPKDCIVIEDSSHGVQAAKLAGMYCIAYVDPHEPAQDVSLADEVVEDYRGLLDRQL